MDGDGEHGEYSIRVFAPEDAPALTTLLHKAYAELGHMGLNFTAIDQDEKETLARIGPGACWLAEDGSQLVASVTFAFPTPSHLRRVCRTACDDNIAWLNQLAVDPEYRGLGLARRLRDTGYGWAAGHGAQRVGVDTATPAVHLVALYHGWGFEDAEIIQWPGHNYSSTVMTHSLRTV